MPAGSFIVKRRNDNDNGTTEVEISLSAAQSLGQDANGRPVALSTPSSGVAVDSAGYLGMPVVPFIAATAVIATHNGKCLLHSASDANARTITIPANGTTPLVVGFKCDVHNLTAEVVTIAITADTLTLAAAGTTGSVELEQDARVTLHKITSTGWVVFGYGVTDAA